MKILVIGSSGKTGQKVLEQLANTDHSVTALIRTSEQENMIRQFGAKPLLGDLEHDVNNLVQEQEAIIFVAGSRGKNVQGVDYQGLVNIVNAAVKARINRFLYIGSINTGKKPNQYIQELKDFYQHHNEPVPEGLLAAAEKPEYYTYLQMKELAENHLIQSDINYTILRAGLLTQEIGSGQVSVTLGTLNAFGKISRDNVANMKKY